MKVVIPFEFELKQLAHNYGRSRGHFENFIVQSSATVEVREVDAVDAPVAAVIQTGVDTGKSSSHPVFRASEGVTHRDVRWIDGGFYVDQGPAVALDNIHTGWADPHVSPFRQTRLSHTDPAKVSRRHISAFEASKTKNKVEDCLVKIAEAVERIVIVGGRVLERCPEPVRIVSKDGSVAIGFAPSTPGDDLPIASFSFQSFYDTEPVPLIDENGDVPERVTMLMPEVFGGDIEPGQEMRVLRDGLADLSYVASDMPLSNLLATRQLRGAVLAASIHPDERVVEAVEAFIAVGDSASEFAALKTAYEYAFSRSDRHVHEHPINMARGRIANSISRMAEILPEMRRHLTSRLYQGENAQPIMLQGISGALRRAQTKGEVFRAAVVAGLDPVELYEAAATGRADVVLIEEHIPAMYFREGHERHNGVTRSMIVGARIAAEPGQEPKDYFAPFASDDVRVQSAQVLYPTLDAFALPEIKP